MGIASLSDSAEAIGDVPKLPGRGLIERKLYLSLRCALTMHVPDLQGMLHDSPVRYNPHSVRNDHRPHGEQMSCPWQAQSVQSTLCAS